MIEKNEWPRNGIRTKWKKERKKKVKLTIIALAKPIIYWKTTNGCALNDECFVVFYFSLFIFDFVFFVFELFKESIDRYLTSFTAYVAGCLFIIIFFYSLAFHNRETICVYPFWFVVVGTTGKEGGDKNHVFFFSKNCNLPICVYLLLWQANSKRMVV